MRMLRHSIIHYFVSIKNKKGTTLLNLYLKIIKIGVCSSMLWLTACQQHFLLSPTEPTEADLVANSVANGLSQEINIGYAQAYENLRDAYSQCMAFTSEKGFVFTDNKFEPDLEMATLFGRSKGGVYLYKTTLESISPTTTNLTLYLPKGYQFPRSRLKQDAIRALGQDRLCRTKHNSAKGSEEKGYALP